MNLTDEDFGKLLYEAMAEESAPDVPYVSWDEVPEQLQGILRKAAAKVRAAVIMDYIPKGSPDGDAGY